jgi:hypothetical protein
MRMFKDAVQKVANRFASGRGQAWPHVGVDVREALIDAEIMDCVRAAHSADNETPFTPAELLTFRAALVRALDDGVPSGSMHRVRFACA